MSNKALKITILCIAAFAIVCLYSILRNRLPKEKPQEPEVKTVQEQPEEESTVKTTKEGAPILGT